MGCSSAQGHDTSIILVRTHAATHRISKPSCLPAQTWKALGLQAAPNYLEDDGKVRVPPKWKHILDEQAKRAP